MYLCFEYIRFMLLRTSAEYVILFVGSQLSTSYSCSSTFYIQIIRSVYNAWWIIDKTRGRLIDLINLHWYKVLSVSAELNSNSGWSCKGCNTDVLIQIFITISQPLCKIITNKHVHIDVPQYESILVSTVFSNYICDKYILLLMRIGTQVLNSSLWYWDFYFRKFNYHWINNTWIQLIF